MNPPLTILYKVLVKPFYKQNAGLLLFVLIMMFGIVNELDGADIFDYHYALIMGMFANDIMFGLVILVWLIYAYKCAGFVINSFWRPENSFLYIYSFRPAKELFFKFLLVQLLLFLPVLLYVIAIVSVAFHNHLYAAGSFVITCLLLICCASAWWYVYHIQH